MPPARAEDVAWAAEVAAELVTELADELDPETLFRATGWIGGGQLLRGDVAGLEQTLARLSMLSDKLAPRFRWRIVATRALLATLRGDLQSAEEMAQEALALGRGTCDTGVEGVHTTQLLIIRWLQGRAGEMVTAVEHFVTLCRWHQSSTGTRCWRGSMRRTVRPPLPVGCSPRPIPHGSPPTDQAGNGHTGRPICPATPTPVAW
jgi:hypothetical protein